MAFLFKQQFDGGGRDTGNVEFWHHPERSGWLMKQGEYIKTWRRRWFVLKEGRIFWFKENTVTSMSKPRGVIQVDRCVSVKGAEDAINMPNAFEISTHDSTRPMYFIADTDKEKEEWINAVGRAIVRHSNSLTEKEIVDY
eukprot:jgi/Chlat1/4901/Chrsp31S04910